MIELSMAEWLTAALMSMTCTLLVAALMMRHERRRRMVATAAIVVGTTASFTLFQCYRGQGGDWFEPYVKSAKNSSPGKRLVMLGNGGSGAASPRQGRGGNAGAPPAGNDSDEGGDAGPQEEVAGAPLSNNSNWWFDLAPKRQFKLSLQPIRDCADCPEMVPLEPGYAALGADNKDTAALPFERPQRVVSITKPFAIGRTEITVAQFQKYLTASKRAGACPGPLSLNPDHPITCVTLPEAQAFAAWLSEYTGQSYRLPSAGEWEYAARAGTKTTEISNQATSLKTVASLPPNGFGLHDMAGNVAEWTADCWLPSLRRAPSDGGWATRGGDCSKRVVKDAAWSDEARFTRASARRPLSPTAALPGVGFRLVREIRLTH